MTPPSGAAAFFDVDKTLVPGSTAMTFLRGFRRAGLVDTRQVVRLLRSAREACASIQVGSYLEADGTKQHEGLFEADDVTIARPRR